MPESSAFLSCRCRDVAVAIWAWSCLAAMPAAAGPSDPFAPAAELRAAHAGGPATRYRVELSLAAGRGTPADISDARPVRLSIGETVLIVQEGEGKDARHRIYDLANRRLVAADAKLEQFESRSLHALVYARLAVADDLRRRRDLHPTLTQGRPLPAYLAPFWVATAAGVDPPPGNPLRLETFGRPGGEIGFRFDGTESAIAEYADEDAPREVAQGILRYVRYELPVHPQIYRALARNQRALSALSLRTVTPSGSFNWTTIVVGQVTAADAAYPLAQKARAGWLDAAPGAAMAAFRRDVLPVLREVGQRKRAAPVSAERLHGDIRAALDGRRVFDAVLAADEHALRFGAALDSGCAQADASARCTLARRLADAAGRDVRARKFADAARLERDGQHVQAASAWRAIERAGTARGWVVEAAIARALAAEVAQQRRRAGTAPDALAGDALSAFARALRAAPDSATLYREIGLLCEELDRFDAAWLVYDVGRALPGRGDGDPLAEIERLEQQLRSEYPEFF